MPQEADTHPMMEERCAAPLRGAGLSAPGGAEPGQEETLDRAQVRSGTRLIAATESSAAEQPVRTHCCLGRGYSLATSRIGEAGEDPA